MLTGVRSRWCCSLLLGAGCTAELPTDQASRAVVYDVDDRTEVFAYPDPVFRALAATSIVAIIRSDRVDDSDPMNVRIAEETLGDKETLCAGERFIDQPAAASCSGTLIDHDLVLTAGHCVDTEAKCRARRFVFDYRYTADGVRQAITASAVYGCRRRVVFRDDDTDYAVVQLDRPVDATRVPVAIRQDDQVMLGGTPLVVVGFPSGVPAKIDGGGRLLASHGTDTFEASLDTFDSNSGSGVFSASGTLVGVLNKGKPDYVRRGDCNVVNVLRADDVNDDAEESTYVARAVEALCAAGWTTDVCGDTAGWCRPCSDDAQCPGGWLCHSAPSDLGVTWCAAPCGDDTDCRTGHTCNGTRCAPVTTPTCAGQSVWLDNSCGRLVAEQRTCDAPRQVCSAGSCEDAAPGNGCHDPVLLPLAAQILTGTFDARVTDTQRGTCGGAGKDLVFAIDVDRQVTLSAEASGFDTLLHVRRDCTDADSEIACNDDHDPPGSRGSRVEVSLTAGRWFLFLDAYGSASGDWQLELDFSGLPPPSPDAGLLADSMVDAGMAADATAQDAMDVDKADKSEPEPEGCRCAGTARRRTGGPWLILGTPLLLAGRRRRSAAEPG